MYCGILPSSSLVPLFLLVSWLPPLASGLPVIFVFCPWCCSESEDSVNNSRIQHSNCLWFMFGPSLPLYLSSFQVPLQYICLLTVRARAPCQRASSTSKTDSFLWGHGPDTLACKARPSFDGCGTSLSCVIVIFYNCLAFASFSRFYFGSLWHLLPLLACPLPLLLWFTTSYTLCFLKWSVCF